MTTPTRTDDRADPSTGRDTLSAASGEGERSTDLQPSLLGCFFHAGRGGLEKDPDRAAHWYRKAAEQGHVNAQAMLGRMSYLGEGVPPSSAEAIRWYRKAASQGDAGSQFIVGLAYLKGDGVKPNFIQAHRWLRKAAAQGHEEAAQILDP